MLKSRQMRAGVIARVFSYGGKHNRPIHDPNIPQQQVYNDSKTSINHFYEKIVKIKPEKFNSNAARSIAKKRYAFVKMFLSKFLKEWKGG